MADATPAWDDRNLARCCDAVKDKHRLQVDGSAAGRPEAREAT